VGKHSLGDDHRAQGERTDTPDLLTLAANEIKAKQEHRRYPYRDGAKHATGDSERTWQPWLPDSQHDEGNEFEREAQTVDQDVEGHQALKPKPKAGSPADRQGYDRDPRRPAAVQLAEKLRQHAVL